MVLARYAASAAPPGIDRERFAAAALADTYEVVADLVGVGHGIVGPPRVADLLWPEGLALPEESTLAVAQRLTGRVDQLLLVAGDAPDLPGLVLAKVLKPLHRIDVAVAPVRGGNGAVVIGVALPLAAWLTDELLDLDRTSYRALSAAAPQRTRVALAPEWHRLRTPGDLARLDPGLEGWEETRVLLDQSDARGRDQGTDRIVDVG